ncbi:UPF0481 protein At3g47200-like [Oryza glaberrima]|uniref:UPF0481 protein At3g47200-like n=1 Tax=Oryza glaberrima TaxID=4538 RepID=UPI00224BEC46|nr:UPF0481 protein At3g47200-like [Oryza glaberrima]
MGEPTGSCSIDIQRLAADLETKLCNVELEGGRRRRRWPECLISKVKPQVRRVDDSQYTPQVVLVGAYHHKPLDSTDQLAKWTALRRVLPDDGEQRASMLRRCLEAIAGVEDEARSYYEDRAEAIVWKLFVQMLLLDAWYVLHIFNVGGGGAQAGGEAASRGGSAVDYIFAVRDVFYLLENQIPFFILEKVYELVRVGNSGEDHTQTRTSSPPPQPPGATAIAGGSGGSSSTSTVVVDGFLHHLRSLLRDQGYSNVEVDITSTRPCHLVHLLHMHFTPMAMSPAADDAAAVPIPTRRARATVYRWRGATQYHAAGVRFKKRALGAGAAGDARCVLDVELRRLTTLHVPTLTVDNNTWRVLRNLMALEQNNPRLGSHVTAYCLFMSHLAGTASDVALLARKKIIVHFMATDEDVADGFAGLCRGVALDVDDARRNYLQPTWERMERWYSSRPVNWMALLRRRHLSNPLVAIALLAAIAGLVCEVLQAVYAVKSYKTRS